MSTEDLPDESGSPSTPIRGWRLALLVGCVLMILVGIGLSFVGGDPEPAGTGAVPEGASSLTGAPFPGADGEEAAAASTADDSLSPIFLRLGFSGFVGFCLGYLLRTFLKLTLLVVGLILMAIFGLSELGVVTVHWEAFEELYEAWVGRLGEQFSSFLAFLGGSLPSAGLAGLGLYAGLKRG